MGMRIRSLLKTCVFVILMTLQWVRYGAESKQPLPKYIPKWALEIIGWRCYCAFRFGSSAKSCWWSGLCCIWSRLPGRQLFSKERSTSRAWHSAHQGKFKCSSLIRLQFLFGVLFTSIKKFCKSTDQKYSPMQCAYSARIYAKWLLLLRVVFLLGCAVMVLSVPFRLACLPSEEDTMAITVMLCTGNYFLFFCR